MLPWLVSVIFSVGLMVACAAYRNGSVGIAGLHMLIAAATAIGLAYTAVRSARVLVEGGAKEAVVAASGARAIGMVWLWVALGMTATYATGVVVWWEWWHFAIAAAIAACLCFFFERTLQADARNPDADDTMMRLAETIGMIQLAGMGVALLGLLIDGKMTRFLTPRYTDWAANSFFFFGAIAVAIISANDLITRRRMDAEKP
jgi:hypothetical protein